VRKYAQVHYFHSYELVMSSPREAVYMEDGRHVQPAYVAGIMQEFERAFLKSAGGVPMSRHSAPSVAAQPAAPGPLALKAPHVLPAVNPAAPVKPAPVHSSSRISVNSSGPGPVLITVE
jgi:hypothetical protein